MDAFTTLTSQAEVAALVELHRARLLRTITARLHPSLHRRITPEDVLQEAFVAASTRLQHRATAPYTSDFVWLRAIVVQTITDCHRHHLAAGKRDALREVAADAHIDSCAGEALLTVSATSPSGAAIRQENAQFITAALAQLSATDRDILVLRHFEDLGNAEIAEVLGIQGKAASIRYVRAIMRLKELLARHGVTVGDLRGR